MLDHYITIPDLDFFSVAESDIIHTSGVRNERSFTRTMGVTTVDEDERIPRLRSGRRRHLPNTLHWLWFYV